MYIAHFFDREHPAADRGMLFISESEVNNTSKCPVTSKDRRFRDKQHFQMPGDLNKGGKIDY